MMAPAGTGIRPQVVLDTDIGTDVDDALALSVLLGSPEIDLVAVTTVYGDTLLRARMVTRLLALADRTDVAVRAGLRETPTGRDIYWAGHEGATMADLDSEVVVDADDPTAAIRLLVDTVRGNPGKVTVLAVGPLTNIGAAITLDPAFATDVAEIAIMGGHFGDLDRVRGLRRSVLRKAVYSEQGQLLAADRTPGVAGGDELLQAEVAEVHREELEEVGLVRIVAVTQHDLATELVSVVPKLGLDVLQLRVELVVLRSVRPDERFFACHGT